MPKNFLHVALKTMAGCPLFVKQLLRKLKEKKKLDKWYALYTMALIVGLKYARRVAIETIS